MGFFDFLKAGSKGTTAFSKLLHAIVNEANAKKQSSYVQFSAYSSLESFKSLNTESNDFKREFLSFLYEFLLKPKKSSGSTWDDPWFHAFKMIPALLKITNLHDDDFIGAANFIKKYRKTHTSGYMMPDMAFIEVIEKSIRKNGLKPALHQALQLMTHEVGDYSSSEHFKANERIQFLLQGEPAIEISEHDRWGKTVIPFLQQSDVEVKGAWTKLFALSKSLGSKSTPTQKWLKEATPLIEKIGHDPFSRKMDQWLGQMKVILQEIHKSKDSRVDFLRNENHEIVKGLVWCCGLINNPSLHVTLDDYAAWAYKKKPGVGPISAKTGTAAMFAFSLLPVKEGVSRLSKFKMKIKNNTILKSIDKIIKDVAAKNNIAIDELEELSVPDFGIHANEYIMELGDCKAIYYLTDGEIKWQRNGKFQKSVPVDIKAKYSQELKTFKNNIKEIDALLPVVKNRLEQSYLSQRIWTFGNWKSLYIDHPLTCLIGKKLIWHFSKNGNKDQGILMGDNFVNAKGESISWIADDVMVQLWHPIGFSATEIVAWRDFLKLNQIIQPFKQAYREVYIITDAELRTDTYSNRFAAHILRQHQFVALCRQRGWHYQLMGNWDSHNTPSVDLAHWRLTAQFYVNADWNENPGTVNEMGIFNYITTDQVRFLREGTPISIRDVPALVFSEVMRDVDLFVGVTSIGNDVAWQDGGDNFQNTYWREYSFSDLSESAKTRSQVLETLIPSLKIASYCTFDKKFLIVKGKLRTYKIHMGSGNILMEPDDQYLCIVPEGRSMSKEKLFLPFEGDGLLSIILSKAFLLAADDKITDVTITRQIKQ